MEFFNEEWDKLNRACCLSNFWNWKVTDRAAVLSEELFKEVYQNTEKEFSGAKQDEAEQKDFIRNLFQGFLKEMEETIPEQIKNKVADMRVLALGTVTEQILSELKEYSQKAQLRLEELDKEYKEQYQYAVKHMSERAFAAMERSFHDSHVIDCGFEGRNLFFKLRMDGGFDHMEDQYIKLILKDTVVLQGEINKELRSWVYHELYYREEHFTLYIRFSNGTVVLQASDIVCEHLHSFFASDTPLQEQVNEEIVFGKVKDLVAAGKISLEDSMNHPLRESLGDEAFENMEIIISENFDSFGKLAVCEASYKEEISQWSGKKFIAEIKFNNDWGYNPEDMSRYWRRGEELLQYIKANCNTELELWVVWSDSLNHVEHRTYQLEDFTEADLEEIYTDTIDGIAKSRRITITA